MLTSVVLCIIFVFVDRSFSVEAKEICTNDRSASIMETLLKLVKEIQQHSKGRNCDDHQKNPVAFYAGLTKHTSLSGSQTIVYDKIYTNLGQAYDPSNGKFRAPVNGIYYFSCSLLSFDRSFHFMLMKNNDRLGKGYGDEGSDSGSVTGTVILNKGDVMSVQHNLEPYHRRSRVRSIAPLLGI